VLDVNDVLREAVAFTRIELERQGVAIETALDDGLPAIRGDRVQLQQVLVNLLLNACDAMGGVSAGARRVDVASRRRAGGEVLVEVADRGRGLEPADAERIFEPFFSTKPNGLGMGLSICRSIVVSHGGRIWAASNDGPGVTMRLTLPAAPGGE
jgi:signal transduction histidine kinase